MRDVEDTQDGLARVPYADKAVVSQRKLADYVMNEEHVLGGPKCRFLKRFGFSDSDLGALRIALLEHVRDNPAAFDEETGYGKKWVVRGPLRSPDGRDPDITSVWQIDFGAHGPKFITITDLDKEMR